MLFYCSANFRILLLKYFRIIFLIKTLRKDNNKNFETLSPMTVCMSQLYYDTIYVTIRVAEKILIFVTHNENFN